MPGVARLVVNGLLLGAAAVVAQGAGFTAGAVGIGVPAAIDALVGGQPFECRGNGCLGLRRAPELLGDLRPIGHDTGPQRLGTFCH